MVTEKLRKITQFDSTKKYIFLHQQCDSERAIKQKPGVHQHTVQKTLPLTKRLSEMVSIQGWLPLKIKRSRLSFLAAEYMMLRGGWRSYRFVPCTGTGIGLKGMVRPSVGGLCTWGGWPFLKVQGSVEDTISIWKHSIIRDLFFCPGCSLHFIIMLLSFSSIKIRVRSISTL